MVRFDGEARIDAKGLVVTRGGREVLSGVDFAAQAGEFVGVIGPNGAGKTSMLRALMHFDAQAQGMCNLWDLSVRERARQAAWLAQERELAWDMLVEEVVALGRMPWGNLGGNLGGRLGGLGRVRVHEAAIESAVARLGLEGLLGRRFWTLSGGERARVLIARVLAQETPIIMADEPIDALDPAYQIQVMQIFQALAQEGRLVVMSIHDLGLVARYCSRVVILSEGAVYEDGAPDAVLSDENLAAVFGVKVFRAEAQGPILQAVDILES